MKKLLFIISAIFLPFSSNAWEACGTDADGNTANCEYQIINGTLTIRGVGNNGNIGNWWKGGWSENDFIQPWKNKGVTNVIIEDSIKDLGSMGFQGISSANPIEIPASVSTIGYSALRYVTAPEIIIPNSVTSIEEGAFVDTYVEKINIPDSVVTISPWAFRRAYELKDIVIGDSVAFIDGATFSGCGKLESITIGENTVLSEAIFDWGVEERSENLNNIKIYCTGNLAKCQENAGVFAQNVIPATTKKINGVTYVYDKNGKLVTTSGHRTERRIYTIDEANAVAGPINRVSIKYR
ncbi:MAG: leucine-rich repeat domain-containing protein [Alphaproteobacteria bacterium]|nr:leucine-rich repeat domain-containing protein [Alphaproteobacteria bacterium]